MIFTYFVITGAFIYCLPDIKQITTTGSDQSRFLTSTIKKKTGRKTAPYFTCNVETKLAFLEQIYLCITHKAKFQNFLYERLRPYKLDMAEDQNFLTFVSGTV